MLATRTGRRRRGATIVESALVLTVFLMLLFGLFEYCRFLLVLHVTNNAARDGARYAVVNVDKPSTFNTSIQTYTKDRMGGVDQQISGFQVAVYPVDPVGLAQTPPVIRPKTNTAGTYPDPFNSADPNNTVWNNATFTERIAVTIKGTYRPILPTLLFMPTTIDINITGMSTSEG